MKMIEKIFGLSFLIAITTSMVRINIWHDKLKQMCFSRGDTLYQELIAHQKLLSSHLSSFHVMNLEYSSQMNECQNDMNSKLKLQLLVDAVQLCMDEQTRLLKDQKEIFISRLLEVVCQLHVLGGGQIHDRHCLNITGTKLSACRQIFQEFQTILLPLIYNTEECSEARRLLDCLENEISVCNDTTRNEFKSANNVTFHTLYGCPNMQSDAESSKIKEKITSIKPEYENKPIVRFNFTVIESSNDNDKIEDIKTFFENQAMVRFNFTKTDLREKCNQKGDIFPIDVESTFAEFLSVKAEKQFSIALSVKSGNLKKKEHLRAVVNENCYKDSDIRNILEKILNAVEQCLNEEDRMEEEEKGKLLNKTIEKFCSGLDITASLIPSDQECFHDFATFFKLALCSRNASVEQVYFDNLPLLFASSREECNNLYRVQNCKLNVHEDCKDSTKSWLQEQFNQERRFAGCEDILYDTTFIG